MQFYLDLLTGTVQMQDLSDGQVDKLAHSWQDDDGELYPTPEVWNAAGKELDKRKIDKARKKLKEMAFKPINRDFFKV